MLITNTPICPRCGECVMTRQFSRLDWAGIILFGVLLFPLSIWIYLNPPQIFCRGCGKVLSTQPQNDAA